MIGAKDPGALPPGQWVGKVGLSRTRRGFRWPWLLMLLAGACSHAPVAVPARPTDEYAFRQTQAGVRIALDPFFNVERTRAAFTGGEDFPEKGLLPIQVIIENGSPEDIQVSPEGFRLDRPDGRAETALSPANAFEMVKLPWGLWALVPIVGGAPTAYRNESRLKDIESQALRETTIAAGRSATGFVYFAIPENTTDLAGRRVVFPIKGPGGRELTYEVSIAGHRDTPVPAPSAEAVVSPAPTPAPSDPTAPQAPIRIEGYGGKGVIIRSPPQ